MSLSDEASGTNAFAHLVLGSVMSSTKNDLLTIFMKVKPPIF